MEWLIGVVAGVAAFGAFWTVGKMDTGGAIATGTIILLGLFGIGVLTEMVQLTTEACEAEDSSDPDNPLDTTLTEPRSSCAETIDWRLWLYGGLLIGGVVGYGAARDAHPGPDPS